MPTAIWAGDWFAAFLEGVGVEAGVEMTVVWAAGVVSRAGVRLGAIFCELVRNLEEELRWVVVGKLVMGASMVL